MRGELWATAVRLGQSVWLPLARAQSSSSTTADTNEFYFLEVNTRLQVEHGVTEEVTGIDLVEWMVRQAAGELAATRSVQIPPAGASIQVRVYAEDPGREFRPSSGLLTAGRLAPGRACRDLGRERNGSIAVLRSDARQDHHQGCDAGRGAVAARAGLSRQPRSAGSRPIFSICAISPSSDVFAKGEILTRTLATFPYQPTTIEVLAPGTVTTIQDYPGRLGYWDVGVPPSGPMDSRSLRLANRAVGNPDGAAALEMTLSGPSLKFNSAAVICLMGAAMPALLDGREIASGRAVTVEAGQTLKLGTIASQGVRTYLAVRGGFDVPDYLGAKSTFTLGRFGGHGGRPLLIGDVLHIGEAAVSEPRTVPDALMPPLSNAWRDRRALRPAWRAGLLHRGGHRDLFRRRLGGALQLEPDRRAPHRPQAEMGAQRRRRGGAASVEHPRQRLCHRRGGFHRRHADHPRAGRPSPRRLRLSGDDRASGAVEDRPAEARRQGPLRALDARAGRTGRRDARGGDRVAQCGRKASHDRACSRRAGPLHRGRDCRGARQAARRRTVAPATRICSSSTGRSCSTSSCASACMG